MATDDHSGLQSVLAQLQNSEVDEQLLYYKGFSLNCSDLDLLISGRRCCVNSRTVDFYFRLISDASQCTRAGRLLLVPTSVSSSIIMLPSFEELYETVGMYGLREKEVLVFVVEECDDQTSQRHWSLLVYVKKQNRFLLHDSREEVNKRHALKLYKAVRPFLGYPELVERRTPQQTHSADSGLFVMAVAREICAWCDLGLDKEDDQLWFSELEKMSGAMADDMRKELLELINVLMDED